MVPEQVAGVLGERWLVVVIATTISLCVLSHFNRVRLCVTPWTVAHQAPLSMGFSRQEYWTGLLFPSLGYLPDPGIEPPSLMSPALAGRFFTIRATWEAHFLTAFDSRVAFGYLNVD